MISTCTLVGILDIVLDGRFVSSSKILIVSRQKQLEHFTTRCGGRRMQLVESRLRSNCYNSVVKSLQNACLFVHVTTADEKPLERLLPAWRAGGVGWLIFFVDSSVPKKRLETRNAIFVGAEAR